MYSGGAEGHGKMLPRIEAFGQPPAQQDLSNVGSIKEMALFSRIVNY
jgi:hypothetical protein